MNNSLHFIYAIHMLKLNQSNVPIFPFVFQFIQLMKIRPEVGEFIKEGCIEEIQNSIEWADKYEETVTAWLTWNVDQWDSFFGLIISPYLSPNLSPFNCIFM